MVNTSGFSNETFIVSTKYQPSDKVVFRLFKSKASDFVTESHIFRTMGQKGIGPKEIEITDTYRVEEYINGRALTMYELRNPFIA